MATKRGRDFYAELGIEKTSNQGQIKQAYRKMAMKYHPDKNPGDEASAEKFKNLSTAYAVLSDPNKRRQYDLHGEDGSISDVETIKVEELGTVGRLFGALITKAGIPIPTEITPRVLSSAQHISSGVERVSGFELPTVQNLNWGQPVGAKVERQSAHFYRIQISERDLSSGIIISCSSASADKFKLIFFDQEGNVSFVEESQKKKKAGTQANLLLVPFPRYNLSVPISLSTLKHMDDDVPPVFMLLDTYDKEVRSLLPGNHLFCIYGDNWFQPVHYTLNCLQAIEKESGVVEKLVLCETILASKKDHLEALQPEFMEIKKKYEDACSKLKSEAEEAEQLLMERERLYAEYIRESSSKYDVSQVRTQSKKTSNSVPGLLGKFLK